MDGSTQRRGPRRGHASSMHARRRAALGFVHARAPAAPRLAGRVAKRVHAHGLRHTHAAQLRAEDVEIGLISRQLGHRSIATTARYLDPIAPLDVINAMRRREW